MNRTPSEVTRNQLMNELDSVIKDTERLLHSAATASSDKAASMQASLAQGLSAATARLAQIKEKSLEQASAAVKATDEYVHENPWHAVGIVAILAAAAGIVLGMMSRSGDSSE